MLAVAFAPALGATTLGSIVFGVLAAGFLLYGRTEVWWATLVGVTLVAIDLELAWRTQPLTIQIAGAVSGLALLTAFELDSWSVALAATPSDRAAYAAHLGSLLRVLGLIALIVAALVLVARGLAHGPLLGVVGALGALALTLGLLELSRRVR